MSLQELGNTGELIAAIATVVTLIYFSTQIRQNNRSLAEANLASVNASQASINSRISSDPEFAEPLFEGRIDPQSLDPVELERFPAFVQDILNVSVDVGGLQSSHNARTPARRRVQRHHRAESHPPRHSYRCRFAEGFDAPDSRRSRLQVAGRLQHDRAGHGTCKSSRKPQCPRSAGRRPTAAACHQGTDALIRCR